MTFLTMLFLFFFFFNFKKKNCDKGQRDSIKIIFQLSRSDKKVKKKGVRKRKWNNDAQIQFWPFPFLLYSLHSISLPLLARALGFSFLFFFNIYIDFIIINRERYCSGYYQANRPETWIWCPVTRSWSPFSLLIASSNFYYCTCAFFNCYNACSIDWYINLFYFDDQGNGWACFRQRQFWF
jgi:hypothetical protein